MAQKSSNNLFLINLLGKEEYHEFQKALVHDKTIVPSLLKILEARSRESDKRDDLINDPNYPIKRAYLDGRLKEIEWLLNQLTPNK
jgi:hypothetical protein